MVVSTNFPDFASITGLNNNEYHITRGKVDENGDNPAWKAIGYEVSTYEKWTNTSNKRPLEKGVIETMHESDSTILQSSIVEPGIFVVLLTLTVHINMFALTVGV
ncbi:unnamed protein product [Lupinus luteus]|uniref:Uncharacterized protein n=1 Tax=Lupinus luteus TaxID=3873 RepID=A0AAV1WU32_LUPLU